MAGLIPFNRRKNVKNLQDPFNMLDDFFNDTWLPGRSLMNDTFKVDVKETEKEYIVEAELPGVKKEEVSLELNEGRLSIGVSRNEQVNEEADNYVHKERRYSSMQRSLYLADAANDGVAAKLEEGILKVTVPKDPKADKKRKIEIQ